jgi:hypothetical protein
VANVSDWKGFEKAVARALGGKRRFRTTENYGKLADDVKFLKEMRKRYPKVTSVAVECKKRKTIGLHSIFQSTKKKYGKQVILASKVTRKQMPALVTVELEFFQKLWWSWLGVQRFPREEK